MDKLIVETNVTSDENTDDDITTVMKGSDSVAIFSHLDFQR